MTGLSFDAAEQVAAIKVLLPLLTNLEKLSVRIKTEEQAIELKEIKTLANNLKYFELSLILQWDTKKCFGKILENLPTGLDNWIICHSMVFGITEYSILLWRKWKRS